MKKILFIIILLIPINIFALEYPKINSKQAIIYDLKEYKILYEKGNQEQTSIASLTKIMTTITAIENIKDLNEKVTITQEILNTVRWDASIAGLKVGNTVTYKDLLYASMLPSGADATNALAISLSGSINAFVNDMNTLAKKLEMNNTHFINVTGLDAEGHYSTTTDLIKLLKYALNNELFKEIFTTKEYILSTGLKVKSTIYSYNNQVHMNTNKILGSKTGFTQDAGLCLATLMIDEKHDIITITLGANRINGIPYNIIDNLSLINFIEKNYNYYTLSEPKTIIKELPVEYSTIDKYKIKTTKLVEKYLPSDYDKKDIKINYEGLNKLSYKNKKDTKLGTIKYYYKDTLIQEEDVILKEEIKLSIKKILLKYKYLILFVIILMLFIVYKIIKRKRKKRRRKK